MNVFKRAVRFLFQYLNILIGLNSFIQNKVCTPNNTKHCYNFVSDQSGLKFREKKQLKSVVTDQKC